MNNARIPDSNWQLLFEAALTEHNPLLVAERFQTAKDAIMDRIEDSFETASLSERRLLVAALNTVVELERSPSPNNLHESQLVQQFGHAA